MWISEKRIKELIDGRASRIAIKAIQHFMDEFGFKYKVYDSCTWPKQWEQEKEYPLLKEYRNLLKYLGLEEKIIKSQPEKPEETIITKIKKNNKK